MKSESAPSAKKHEFKYKCMCKLGVCCCIYFSLSASHSDPTATNTQIFNSANGYRSPLPDALPISISFSLRFGFYFFSLSFEINRTILRTHRETYDHSNFERHHLNYSVFFFFGFNRFNKTKFGLYELRISLKLSEGRSQPEHLLFIRAQKKAAF